MSKVTGKKKTQRKRDFDETQSQRFSQNNDFQSEGHSSKRTRLGTHSSTSSDSIASEKSTLTLEENMESKDLLPNTKRELQVRIKRIPKISMVPTEMDKNASPTCVQSEVKTGKDDKELLQNLGESKSLLSGSEKYGKSLIPVSSSCFKGLRTSGQLFCDKSLLIAKVFVNPSKALVITRPRRWGKSLNMSMIYYFFSCDEKRIYDTAELFKDLKIMKIDRTFFNVEAELGAYPVIQISLKNLDRKSFEAFLYSVKELTKQAYKKFLYLEESDKLCKVSKNDIKKILYGNPSEYDLKLAIYNLSEYLSLHYEKQVIVLIDEYDNVLNDIVGQDHFNDVMEFTRGFFGSIFKDNQYLKLGLMTGIFNVLGSSFFSSFNNFVLKDFFDDAFKGFYGFTQTDIEDILKSFKSSLTKEELEERKTALKEYFNGYNSGSDKPLSLYNPFSIMRCIDNDFKLLAYWANVTQLKMIDKNFVKSSMSDIVQLLNKNVCEKPTFIIEVYRNLSYDELVESKSIWTILLYLGCLTYTSCTYLIDTDCYECEMRIPNKEVSTVFRKLLKLYYFDEDSDTASKLLKSLMKTDVKQFVEELRNFLSVSSSFMDSKEIFYHGFMLALATVFSSKYRVRSNIEMGDGRCDIVLEPKYQTNKTSIIIEVKAGKNDKDAKRKAQEAVQQIEDKRYYAGIMANEALNKSLHLGLGFYKKKVCAAYLIRNLKDGTVTTISQL